MKKLLLLSIALVLGFTGYSQLTHFQQTVGTPLAASFGSVRMASGDFYAVTVSATSGFNLAKYNATGALVENRALAVADFSVNMVASVQNLNGSALIVTGQGTPTSLGYPSYYVAKIDLASGLVKMVTESINGFSYTTGPKVTITSDAIFVNYPDYYTSKIGRMSHGLDHEWMRSCEGDTTSGKNPSMDAKLIGDSFMFVCKNDSSGGRGSLNRYGDFEFFHKYHGTGYTRIYSLAPSSDGNAIMAGLHATVYASPVSSPMISKVAPDGTVIWSKLLDEANPAVTFSRFVDVVELPDGRIAAFATKQEAYSDTYFDGICYFDQNGNLLAAHKLGGPYDSYQMYDAKVSAEGILMTGTVYNYTTSTTSSVMIFTDFSLDQVCHHSMVTLAVTNRDMGAMTSHSASEVRLTSLTMAAPSDFGTMAAVAGVNPESCSSETGIVKGQNVSFSVSPNPVSASDVTVRFTENGNYAVSVIDITGKTVRTSTATGNSAVIATDGLNAGIYMVTIHTNGALVGSSKLIVQ